MLMKAMVVVMVRRFFFLGKDGVCKWGGNSQQASVELCERCVVLCCAVLQCLSEGLQGFEQCRKLADTPFPFPW